MELLIISLAVILIGIVAIAANQVGVDSRNLSDDPLDRPGIA
jgi:hypothetical protein